ncbi:FimV/HubP family polar landmark protein [Oceanimonas smirnovii]|uniref:FimV/HubP family polar landmark protein n=1 Tax=Oceanimonas smirnovii TaxID=264574 RepID=UPI001FE1A1AB|nr:FimV/HubP family polar landmark protein [Oceanimonas smirnovii]
MRRCRPPLYSVLALWLSFTLSATAQEFYIELRGPETREAPSVQVSSPLPVQARRYGPVRTTDTLWSIAAQHTQAPATVQQTMVALYYLNPGAFVRGNINYLQRGATLTLPTLSQAQQRTPREAEAEFRRLSRQGNRTVTRAPAPAAQAKPVQARPAPRPEPAAEPVPAPAVATPPAAAKPEPTPASNGLSEPRAVQPAAVATPPRSASAVSGQPAAVSEAPADSSAGQAEQTALARLQAQLLDELREQVAMSNEQLAELSDNNQALRNRLGQLTAEVNELKLTRADTAAQPAADADKGWLSQLLKQPLNLAILLTLPALLLLALFTLWWRRRTRQELAEQDHTSEQMLDEDTNDFDDIFAVDLPADEPHPAASEQPEVKAEPEIDEDAFARFLEEQQQLEAQEAADETTAEQQEEALFDDMAQAGQPEPLLDDETIEPEPRELRFDDDAAAAEDILFEDETTADQEEVFFDDEAVTPEPEQTAPPALDEPLDEALFDLGDDEPQPASASEAPESLAEQGAVNKAADEFDDILAGTLAEQEADALSAMQSDSRSFADEREPMVRQELDDYADLLGNSQDVDIDADEGGMGAKLDLARAYIEIDDIDSARELLNEALEKGSEQHQNDARKLLQRLDRR